MIKVDDGIFSPIEELKVGDRVTAFDSTGTLRSSYVSNVFRNVTDRFYIVTDAAEANGRETVVTGGHAFLSENGTFERLDALLARGEMVVGRDDLLRAIEAREVVYSAETAHLFEEGQVFSYAANGNTALSPEIKTGC